ncbi:baseplate J/gp47 family protein [Nocardioides convexus]|uniref:baseplate J/gp47 family protein n=1 Tax=Nocardioides convexus TaxID=2712224 RepID=UPI0024184D99|nr:baseplate J/gp47 family protein [Nocardioides convexus]
MRPSSASRRSPAPRQASSSSLAVNTSLGDTVPDGFTVVGVNGDGTDVAFELADAIVVSPGTTTLDVTMHAAEAGSDGNGVPAGTLVVVTATSLVLAATATTSSSGGVEPESLEQYLERLTSLPRHPPPWRRQGRRPRGARAQRPRRRAGPRRRPLRPLDAWHPSGADCHGLPDRHRRHAGRPDRSRAGAGRARRGPGGQLRAARRGTDLHRPQHHLHRRRGVRCRRRHPPGLDQQRDRRLAPRLGSNCRRPSVLGRHHHRPVPRVSPASPAASTAWPTFPTSR